MKHPAETDFKTAVSDAAVTVTFVPTKSTYTFYRLDDPDDIRRHGLIMSEPDDARMVDRPATRTITPHTRFRKWRIAWP